MASPEEIAEEQKKNCIFCKIVKGEIPARKVYEDDSVLAILDINPAAKGHTLVMPKEHYPILPIIPPEVQKKIFKASKYIMKGVRVGSVNPVATLFIANGAVAGQQSPHFLFHIIPRIGGDGLKFDDPKGVFEEAEARSLTESLRANMQAALAQHKGVPAKPPEKEYREPVEMPSEGRKQNLAEILHSNESLKRLIIDEPERLKSMMAKDKDLAALFKGIDIDKLSKRLASMDGKAGMDGQADGKHSKDEKHEKSEEKVDLDAVSSLFTR